MTDEPEELWRALRVRPRRFLSVWTYRRTEWMGLAATYVLAVVAFFVIVDSGGSVLFGIAAALLIYGGFRVWLHKRLQARRRDT